MDQDEQDRKVTQDAPTSYFDYESIPQDEKVRIETIKLKGNVSLWWEHLQTDKQRRVKEKIKTWVKIVINEFYYKNSC